MFDNNTNSSLISKIKLSPLGWIFAGAIVIMFWDSLLQIGLFVLAGYMICKYQTQLLKLCKALLKKFSALIYRSKTK